MSINYRKIAFCPAFVILTGDHASAVVLSQIMYWHQGRLRVEFPRNSDTYWLAKSRAEMCEETGITLEQYNRIIPLLVKRELIITERHLFRNRVTPFIRLTEKGLGVMQEHYPLETHVPNASKSHAPATFTAKTSHALLASANNLLTYNVTETVTESDNNTVCICDEKAIAKTTEIFTSETGEKGECEKKEIVVEVKSNASATAEVVIPQMMSKVTLNLSTKSGTGWKPSTVSTMKGKFMKAEDALKAHKAALTGSLGGFWKSRLSLIYKDEYVKDLTGKEHGQLKQLSKKLGEQVRPVISYVIEHWWHFASVAGFRAGHQSWPQDPHPGYLLMHYHVAVELLDKSLKKPKPPIHTTPPTYSLQSIAPAEVPHQLTQEEFTQIMKDLESP